MVMSCDYVRLEAQARKWVGLGLTCQARFPRREGVPWHNARKRADPCWRARPDRLNGVHLLRLGGSCSLEGAEALLQCLFVRAGMPLLRTPAIPSGSLSAYSRRCTLHAALLMITQRALANKTIMSVRTANMFTHRYIAPRRYR